MANMENQPTTSEMNTVVSREDSRHPVVESAHAIGPSDPFLEAWKDEYYSFLQDLVEQCHMKWNTINMIRWGSHKEPLQNPVCVSITTPDNPVDKSSESKIAAEVINKIQSGDDQPGRWHGLEKATGDDRTFTIIAKIEHGSLWR